MSVRRILISLMASVVVCGIAIPAQAAVMNLFGVAASYGVIVAVFQWGWLDGVIGLDGINAAFDALADGRAVRTVVRF